ncbi:MAG: sulfotransferase family 2 domain-containing protein [Marinomonas sp.]|uniref:sulfotransferase family 2 domain-containing protein n=1 Tax=Marinomonas sp. TaxID=1904862 RepID=UPI003F9A79D6
MKNTVRSACKKYLKRSHFPYRKYQNKNKCIFIHIPKTAGSSLLQALGKKRSGGRDHVSWLVYQKSNAYKFDSYFKFAFVRDPLDRAYSAYNYLLKGGNQSHDLSIANMLKKYSNFEDFITEGLGKGYFRSHVMFLPQSNFVINEENQIAVDFIGKFENINDDFQYVKDKLGLKLELKQVNKNTTSNKNHLENIKNNKEVMSVIASIYAQDYLSFGYALH